MPLTPLFRYAFGPVCIGLAAWCAAGRMSLAAADSASIRLAIAAPWWVGAIATAAAALVPAWRRSPLLALPALLSVLPWLPVPLPAVVLVWTGPLAWVPIGLSAIAAVVATGAGRPLRAGNRAGLLRDPRYQHRAAACLTLAMALAAAWCLSPRLPVGDEPQYLVITQSLIKDGDLRIENNHRARDYAAYVDKEFAPDFLRRGRDGEIYSIHAPGLPVLVLPAFWLFGYRGAQATVLLLAALTGGLIWKAGWRATGSVPAAWFAWAAIAGSVTFLLQSVTIFPDGPAMLAVAASVLVLLALSERNPESSVGSLKLAGISVLLAALPWLHTRFAVLSAGFGLLVAWAMVRKSVPVTPRTPRLALFLAVPVLSAIAWFAYFQIIYGTPNPAAPYGARPEMSWAFVPGGLAGLLFDQQFGLLVYAPVLAVAAIGLSAGRALASRSVALATSIVSVLYLCVVTTYWMWWAGVPATPARLAAVVLPGLAVPLARAWDRAGAVGRAVFLALLGLSVASTATVIGVGRGSLTWNIRGGSALWLEWLGPVVDLARGAPSFFWRLAPENLATEIPFFVHILGWFAAGAVGLAVAWAASRTFHGRPDLGPVTAAWGVALSLMAMLQVGWWLSSVSGPRPMRSQIAVLDRLREGQQLSKIAPFSLGRAPDLAGLMRLSPSEPARPDDAGWGSVRGLPAGTYQLRVVTSRPRQGEIALKIGEAPRPWRTLTAVPLSRQAFVISLPADVSVLAIQPDASLKQVGGNVELLPLSVRRGGPSQALGVMRYGTTDVFFLDLDAFQEEGGFWVQGGRSTEVVLAAGAGRAAVPLVLQNGGSPNNVRLQIDAELQTVALQPDEAREVAVQVSGPDGVVHLRISSEAGFRPSEAVTGDRRFLGVRVEIR